MNRQGMFSLVRIAVNYSRVQGFALQSLVQSKFGDGLNIEDGMSPEALLVIQAGPNLGTGDEDWATFSGRHVDNALQETLMYLRDTHVWYNWVTAAFCSGSGRPIGQSKAWKLVATIRITAEGKRAVGTVLQP